MSKKAKSAKSNETIKYVVTLRREVTQLQETKVIVEVPADEESEELSGWAPVDYAEDQALKIASGNPEHFEYEDENGNITQDAVASDKVKWIDIESPEDDTPGPYTVTTRKFRPSK